VLVSYRDTIWTYFPPVIQNFRGGASRENLKVGFFPPLLSVFRRGGRGSPYLGS